MKHHMSSKTCVQIFLADLFIITKAKNNSGLEIVPYPISEKMIEDAIKDLEKYHNDR